MVVEDLMQRRFDWESCMEEVLVERLFGILGKYSCDTRRIELWPASSAEHLQNVRKIHILVTINLCIEILCALYHNKMRGQIDAPRERTCRNKYLNFVIRE